MKKKLNRLSFSPFTARKFIPDSVASALAISVLLQPGGPYNNTPLGGDIPILWNASGCRRGHSTTSRKLCFTPSIPPISPHFTLGTSTATSLNPLGDTSGSADKKSAGVRVGTVSYTHLTLPTKA